MLKIRFKDNKYNAVWLVEPKITIGRSATNALVIDDPLARDVHMEVLVDNEHLTLRNLVPSQPVSVNGQPVTGACELKPSDQISLGKIELLVIDPKREAKLVAEQSANDARSRSPMTGWSLKAHHTALGNRVYSLKEQNVVGRSSDCDISLAAAHLSRRHAQLQVVDGMLFVKDLDSANGTFLNGKRVTEARVRRGDELSFDVLTFGVIGPTDELDKTTVREVPVKPPTPVKPDVPISKSRPVHEKAIGLTRDSSLERPLAALPATPGPGNTQGKFGLIFLAILAIAVITTLVVTKK
jgi:pSer/pThr/pTyr-binding forkhead associated (FHA) protein